MLPTRSSRRSGRRRFRGGFAILLLLLLLGGGRLPLASAQTFHSVSGTITLDQDCANPAQPMTFLFCATDRPAFFTRTVTLTSTGGYTIQNVPAGKYNLAVKGSKWLRAFVPNTIDLTANNATGVNGALDAGDCNDDNFIDILDMGILLAAFNT